MGPTTKEGTFAVDMGVLPTHQARPSGQGLAMTFLPVSPQELDCFVIDNNGFILISGRSQEVRCPGGGRREESDHSPDRPVKERTDRGC